MTDVTQWLRERESQEYKTTPYVYVRLILESLADCRRLMKEHEWGDMDCFEDRLCQECGNYNRKKGHVPDCALNALLEGE